MKLRVILVALAMAPLGVTLAAPAGADNDMYCEPRPLVSYCDGPVRENGSWRRCFYNQPLPSYNNGSITGYWPGSGNCYDVAGPGQDPYPWAPQHHLQP
ncbi:CDGP domain-containing protein [Mycolicibacterium holsaticum]|uniref:CDGP domain-containing protein n=1 Tax=Mycolicibacterium holsaticum TaxID=152142 RepID=UPI001E4DC795|nr:hypothetical protein [Mycolicibacterium holsaticum]